MSITQTAHKIASPLLYKSGLYQKIWCARNEQTPFTVVVAYHRVVADQDEIKGGFDIEKGITASVFEKQMRFLRRHFTPVKASRSRVSSSNAMQFAVTLDDGYEDNYLVAAPILQQLGIPATFYVVSDFVGTDRLFWWEQVAHMMHSSSRRELDVQAVMPLLSEHTVQAGILPLNTSEERDYAYRQICAGIRNGLHADIGSHLLQLEEYFGVRAHEEGRKYGLMNWSQCRELVCQGFEIGCHTATHCNVIGIDEAMLKREVLDSISILENHLDTPVESFAYPYGLYEKSSNPVVDVLAETNCKVAYTTQQGVVDADSAGFELPRAKLNRSYDFACAYNIQDTLNCSI